MLVMRENYINVSIFLFDGGAEGVGGANGWGREWLSSAGQHKNIYELDDSPNTFLHG